MKDLDRYPHWVEWNEYDGVYVGRCPDLFCGGIHDRADPVKVYGELRELMGELVEDHRESGEPLPEPSPWPGRDSTFCTPPGVLPPWRHEFEAERDRREVAEATGIVPTEHEPVPAAA